MSNQTHDAKPSKPNGDHTSSVGYGRPPVNARFKPGQSGNPKGRRKGQRNIHTVVDDALNQRIKIREGDRSRSVTKLDAVIMTMVNAALKGDSKAQASLITMMRSLGMTGEPPAATNQEPFTADDEAVIAAYIRRHGSEIQQATEIKDKEEPRGANPSNGRTALRSHPPQRENGMPSMVR
jgi:hypothetical protein